MRIDRYAAEGIPLATILKIRPYFCWLMVIMMFSATLTSIGGVAATSGAGSSARSVEVVLYGTGAIPSAAGYALVGDAGPIMSWHYMTYEEMLQAKAQMGVSSPAVTDAVGAESQSDGLRAPTEAEWQDMVGTRVIIDAMAGSAPAAGPVDLSTSPYFPEIGDQGRIGSCAAWAETYYQFGFLKAKELNWSDASKGNVSHLFSPSWTYNKLNAGTDNGSWEGDNVEIIVKYGAATMDVMPYNNTLPEGYLNWGDETAWRNAVQYRCQGYSVFEKSNLTQYIALVKQALDNQIPVNFAMNSTDFVDNIADSTGNRNNIISSSEYSFNLSNHMQTVVGYNDSKSDLDATPGAFKVANSHGDDFGIGGYYYITYAAFAKMANASDTGIINMGGSAGYAPSALATFRFDPGPSRDANLSVTAVQTSTSQVMARFDATFNAGKEQKMPSFMCFDVSNMSQYVNQAGYNIVLTASSSNQTGSISSFRMELCSSPYRVNQTSFVSPESRDVPKATPGSVNAGMDPVVPSSPQNLSASAGSSQVILSWSAPASDGGGVVTGYRVYRSDDSGAVYSRIVSPSGTSYTDTGLTNGHVYWYKVSAVNAIGEGNNCSAVSATPSQITAPSAPQHVVATPGQAKITISWQAPASTGGSALTAYKVYLDLAGGSLERAVVSASILSYQDNNVSAGNTYLYHVVAVNAVGEGAASAQVQATPQSAAVDNTMLYVGIAIAVIVVIALVVVLMRRKN
ncbi:MAG: fibronectin type III domain-containing protein [Methanomassiliicoccales archaeon]